MSIKIGQTMPFCEIPATSNLTFSPKAYAGKKLVLYFYPKDSTPGCTVEAGEFRDHIDAFNKANTLVVGVSRDNLRSHENFRQKLGLPFELVADTEEKLCAIFNVIKMKNMYGKKVRGVDRSTFLFDSQGFELGIYTVLAKTQNWVTLWKYAP
jgi:peroxiredoxin Q/BCP